MISLHLRSTTHLSPHQAGTVQVSAQLGSSQSHTPSPAELLGSEEGWKDALPCSLQEVRAGQRVLRC